MQSRKNRQLSKGQAELCAALLGLWSLVTFTIGSIFISDRVSLLGWALVVSGLAAVALNAHIAHWYVYKKRRVIIWLPFVMFGSLNIALLLGIGAMSVLATRYVNSFKILTATTLETLPTPNQTNGIGPFIVAVNNKALILHIEKFVFVELLSQASRRMRGFSVEVQLSKDQWSPLCHIPLRGTELYFVPKSLSDATPLAVTRLDERLGPPVPVDETISGWSAWTCPHFECRGLFPLRLVLINVSGQREVLPIPGAAQGPNQLLDRGSFSPMTEKADLSKATLFNPEKCPDW